MSILMTLRIAFKALGRNKLRTALTMLGMIIGVAAVIAVVALGTGAQNEIEEQVKTAGTNLITVYPGSVNTGGVRQVAGANVKMVPEVATILRNLPEVEFVAESVTTRVQLIYGDQNWNTNVEGTNVDIPEIRSWPLKYGSFFTDEDVKGAAKVVVLGSNVSDTLFGEDVDPTDMQIRVRNHVCRVLGVMSSKGSAAGGTNMDDQVFMP
jgi:putative ABC transport system permease protein